MNSNSSSKPATASEWLGLQNFGSDSDGVDDETLKDLYRHACGNDGKREMLERKPFVKGWVNLDSPRAKEIIAVFLSDENERELNRSRNIARTNLEAVAWNDRLGISTPPLTIEVKIHGTRWAMRFISTVPVKRGDERVNEQLPPLPSSEAASTPSVVVIPEPAAAGVRAVPDSAAAATAMKAGGLPT